MKSINWLLYALLVSCESTPDTTRLEKDLLRLEATITLPGVSGRIDHLAYDSAGRRLFVAALGDNTVEIADLAANKIVHTLSGQREPQGLLYIDQGPQLVVANGASGDCVFYDGNRYTEQARVPLGDDADNIRYDGKNIYVGYGSGAIAILDPATRQKRGLIPLKDHPESFQFGDSDHLFVNVPGDGSIIKADIPGRQRPIATVNSTTTWSNRGASANFPMAIDKQTHRLFIGYRFPTQIRLLDTRTGDILATMPCVGDADDLFYDPVSQLLFVSGGEGYIDIFRGTTLVNHLLTRKGARTSLWLPAEKKLVLAVPARSGRDAALWIYSLQ